MPTEPALWMCHLWRWLGGVWCRLKLATGFLVLGPLERGSGAVQGQLLPVPCTGPPGVSYKVVFRWLLLVLGLDVPGKA